MVGVKLYAHIFQCFLFSRRSISPSRRTLSLRAAHYVSTSKHYLLASTRKQKREFDFFKVWLPPNVYIIDCKLLLYISSRVSISYLKRVNVWYHLYQRSSILDIPQTVFYEIKCLSFLFVLDLVSRPKILKWMSKSTQGWMNSSECHRSHFR